MIVKLRDICERDMDLLFLEEIASSSEFLAIFLSKVGLEGATPLSVEQSKTDMELGESDMTVIVQKDNVRYGLLIEDKIDALAMTEQSLRYEKRGKKGVDNGDYHKYFTFIVAPENYLENNDEAKKYPNHITYEECVTYFQRKCDARSFFKVQQLKQAIEKQKDRYQVKTHQKVTDFWKSYAAYQNANHPQLIFRDRITVKGANALWITFHTGFKSVHIYHKTEKGIVDLEFSGLGHQIAKLKTLLRSQVGSLNSADLRVEETGKSAVVRIKVPVIDMRNIDFEHQKSAVEAALQATERLQRLLYDLPEEELDELLAL